MVLLHANAKYALCWQQCFFSRSVKVRGLCYQQQSLAANTCQDVCVQQSHAAKRYCRNLKWTFEDLLPCYCYAAKANSRTVIFIFAGKGADLVNCKLSLHDTRTVNLTLVHCESHTGKQIAIARIKSIDTELICWFQVFYRNFSFVPTSRRG